MKIPPINLKAHFKGVRKDILKGVREILDEQKLILGQYCQELEGQVASMTGAAHAISCANGTDALILSLMALGIGQGDEVVTTPYTFFSTASSIALVGARPVFADIGDRDMNIDPGQVEKAITPKTKAIIVVHLFGRICDMKRILAIAEKHGVPDIEDMAQALGARRGGSSAGTFGDIAATSFYPTKNLGGIGEGGMVLTRRPDLGEKVRKLRVHGMGEKPYIHEMIGFNSRLDEIQAAALRVKLPRLDEDNRRRRKIAQYYNDHIMAPGIILPAAAGKGSDSIESDGSHVHHLFVIRHPERDRLQQYLTENGVQTLIHYPIPPHKQIAYRQWNGLTFLLTEQIHREVLSLPISQVMEDDEVVRVVEIINNFR